MMNIVLLLILLLDVHIQLTDLLGEVSIDLLLLSISLLFASRRRRSLYGGFSRSGSRRRGRVELALLPIGRGEDAVEELLEVGVSERGTDHLSAQLADLLVLRLY